VRLHLPHIPGSSEHAEHHVREAIAAAGDASAHVLASLFHDPHHESWEDAVRRYEREHGDAESAP